MQTSTNPFAQAARLQKVRAIVAQIDRFAANAGLGREDSWDIADMIERWPAERWAAISLCVGKHPPSEETVKIIVAEYRKRGG